MSLTVDTRSVKNYTELCYEPKNNNGKYLYKEKTSYLAFASPAIGIGDITQKNYREVYLRHKFLCHLNEYKLDCPVTLQDVKNHIGLKTNVAFERLNKEVIQKAEEVRGPSINAPEKSLEGFLRSHNIMKEETNDY